MSCRSHPAPNKGTACFNKTKLAPRQRITRPIRLRGGVAPRESAKQDRPREEWIEIPVPAIITEECFVLAQERLHANKVNAPRRTVTPSVVQGLVACRKCGYALYRTSTSTSARKIYYYRCLGCDRWRYLGGAVCNSRPVRQDLLDELVWREVINLLEDPSLIQGELDRRLSVDRACRSRWILASCRNAHQLPRAAARGGENPRCSGTSPHRSVASEGGPSGGRRHRDSPLNSCHKRRTWCWRDGLRPQRPPSRCRGKLSFA
jgi:Recombinase zinc beta ribbon domain